MKASPENKHAYNRQLQPIASKLRSQMTKSEACIWKYILRAGQMNGYQFRRQRPVLNYVADFMCKELMLVIELDRIHSHLLCLSHVAENSGFEALFMKTMQYREAFMELLEAVCGNRVQYDFSIVGGVARDLKPEVAMMIIGRLN